jgi:hypothetical protein
MPEKVMGLGQQKSLKKVLENAESEFLRYEGAPRKIAGSSGRIALVAERDNFDGEFERFEVRVRTDKQLREKLTHALESYNGQVERADEEGGWQIFRMPASGSEDYATARTAVERIMQTVGLPEVWRFEPDDFQDQPVSVELLFRASTSRRGRSPSSASTTRRVCPICCSRCPRRRS